MLIGDSPARHVFIRTAIAGLRLVAPLSLVYCVALPILNPEAFFRYPLPLPLSIWAIAESTFFLFGYLPLKRYSQREVDHPEPPGKEERLQLHRKCLETIADPETFLSGWFLGAPVADIKRENIKQFYAWSLLNKHYEDVDDEDVAELDSVADMLEQKLGRKFEDGWGKAECLRTTFDAVPVQHRPLIWYLVSGTHASCAHM